MEVVETLSEGLSRGFKITLGADELSARQEARLTDIGAQANIPGFRPGKVPLAILKQRFGRAILGEVLEAAVQEATANTLQERGLRPASQPKIDAEDFSDGKDFSYDLAIEILPDIEPVDFSKYELERMKVVPSEADIAEALESLATQRTQTELVEAPRAAKNGDVAVIDFTGKIDGVAFEGGSGEGHYLELGAGQFIPGFEDQVVGQKPNQNFDVSVTFPTDYNTPDLAGKNAIFSCIIKELRAVIEAKIDDEFAKGLGLEDLTALKGSAKTQIEQEFSQAARARVKRQLLDMLAEAHDFDVPKSMMEGEFNAIWEQIEGAKERGELEAEDADKSEDELRAEYEQIALRRVRLGLLLSEIGQRNNITVTEDETNRALMQFARQYPGQEMQLIESYRGSPEGMQQIQAPLFEDKVVDFMLEMAKVNEVEATRAELFAQDEPVDSGGEKKAKTVAKAKKPAKSGAKKASTAKSVAAKGGTKAVKAKSDVKKESGAKADKKK